MQAGNLVPKLRLQPLAQIFGKQRVVAKPTSFLIERRKKQLTFLYRSKKFLARLCASHGHTQRRAKPIEDRGPKHELKQVARKTVEQVLEIGANRAQSAGEF